MSSEKEKPLLLLIAYRAFGDWLYTVPVLPFLFDKYRVHLETNIKCAQLVHDDPRFAAITVFGYESINQNEWSTAFQERWSALEKELKPDRILNLNGTLEVTCIAERWQPEFNLPLPERRAHFSQHCFLDEVFLRCDVPLPAEPKLDEVYFHEWEHAWARAWRKKREGQFVVIIPIAGSTSQKVFHNWLAVTNAMLERFPDSVVYAAGDELCSSLVPEHPRIINMCGNIPIKQAVLLTKYADLVLGPETGLLVAAGMWGTPKIILSTTSGAGQMTKYHKNDYSMQAPIYCSPCHRAIYAESDCHEMRGSVAAKVLYPACSKSFPTELILEKVGAVYGRWKRDLQSVV